MDLSSAGLRKAAVLIASLDASEAAGILARLDTGQAEAIATEMGKSAPFNNGECRQVRDELMAAASAAERLDGNTTPPPPSRRQQPFAFLRSTDTQVLATALADEHPQTIALVLSHLPASESAQVIARSSANIVPAVIRRLAAITPASAEAVDDVLRGLERRIARLRRR